MDGPTDWVDVSSIAVPNEHQISRIEAFGSERNAGVRVYTEYSGAKAAADLTPQEGNLQYTDLTYSPHSFSGW